MKSASLQACREAALAALASPAERRHANELLCQMKSQRGAAAAIAKIVHRTPSTIRCWQTVPLVHVRPFLRAYKKGTLTEASRPNQAEVSQEGRDKANAILRVMRESGCLKGLAAGLGITPSAVRKWDKVPACHVNKVVSIFWNVMPSAEQIAAATTVSVKKPSATVAGVWHRKCLCCGAEFKVNSPFVRRCERHRGAG